MKDSELKKLIRTATKPFRKSVDKNLYIRLSNEFTPFWVFLYRTRGVQRQVTIGRYGNAADEITLSEARDRAAELRLRVKSGFDPASEREQQRVFKTFDDLASDWLSDECSKLKNPQIPARIYNNEIKPYIGGMRIELISGLNIRDILNNIVKSGRMAVANDALLHLKQIFSHGIRLSITNSNPASAFKNKHAGGTEISRNRNLNLKEIETTFTIFRKYKNNFVLENYIAMSILLILGVRKTELTQAKWEEFNFKITDTNTEIIWELPAIRSKTGKPIAIPIPMQLNNLLKILKVLSLGSDYLFPSRRSGKKGHISDDTLNHALANLFGKRTGKANSSTGDVLGAAEIKYFVIHDLRRTCRTLLQVLKVTDNVAEKCLNHTLSGVKGVYNQYDYFDERKEALQKLADLVFPYIDNPDIFMNFK